VTPRSDPPCGTSALIGLFWLFQGSNYTDTHRHGHTDTDTHRHRHRHTDADADADADAGAGAETDTHTVRVTPILTKAQISSLTRRFCVSNWRKPGYCTLIQFAGKFCAALSGSRLWSTHTRIMLSLRNSGSPFSELARATSRSSETV